MSELPVNTTLESNTVFAFDIKHLLRCNF